MSRQPFTLRSWFAIAALVTSAFALASCKSSPADPIAVGCEAQEEVVLKGEFVSSGSHQLLDVTTPADADPDCHCSVELVVAYVDSMYAVQKDRPAVDFLMGSLPGSGSVQTGMVPAVEIEKDNGTWEWFYLMNAGAKGKTPPVRYFIVAHSTDDPGKPIRLKAELRYRKYAK